MFSFLGDAHQDYQTPVPAAESSQSCGICPAGVAEYRSRQPDPGFSERGASHAHVQVLRSSRTWKSAAPGSTRPSVTPMPAPKSGGFVVCLWIQTTKTWTLHRVGETFSVSFGLFRGGKRRIPLAVHCASHGELLAALLKSRAKAGSIKRARSRRRQYGPLDWRESWAECTNGGAGQLPMILPSSGKRAESGMFAGCMPSAKGNCSPRGNARRSGRGIGKSGVSSRLSITA